MAYHYYDATGTRLGQGAFTPTAAVQMDGDWVEYVGTVTVASTARYISPEINTAGKGWLTGDTLDLDRAFFYRVASTSRTTFVPSSRIEGKLTVDLKVALDDYTHPTQTYQQILLRYAGSVNGGYVFYMAQSGAPLAGSYDGTFNHVLGGNVLDAVDGQPKTLQWNVDPETGDYSFYEDGVLNYESTDTPNPWTPIWDTSNTIVGTITAGEIYYVKAYDDDLLVLDFDARYLTDGDYPQGTTWEDDAGRTWTLYGGVADSTKTSENVIPLTATATGTAYRPGEADGAFNLQATATGTRWRDWAATAEAELVVLAAGAGNKETTGIADAAVAFGCSAVGQQRRPLETGTWYRHTDGRFRFVWGRDRSRQRGFTDWERVSPWVRYVNVTDVEAATWATLQANSSDPPAVLIPKVRTALETAGFTKIFD
jgi:hypothetical protein